jgi:hypothetical protein
MECALVAALMAANVDLTSSRSEADIVATVATKLKGRSVRANDTRCSRPESTISGGPDRTSRQSQIDGGRAFSGGDSL